MKVLIIGAAGEVARRLTDLLLKETKIELVLLARQAEKRLSAENPRVRLVSGDARRPEILREALNGVNVVFLNVSEPAILKVLIPEMKAAGIKRLMIAAGMGIYDENTPAFNTWAHQIIPDRLFQKGLDAAELVENSGLDYTYMRMAWLYNDPTKKNYVTAPKGELVHGVQIAREAVCQYVLDLLRQPERDLQANIAVFEPETLDLAKPTFY